MGIFWRYWLWFGIDSLGHCQGQEVPGAKTFMQQHFCSLTQSDNLSDERSDRHVQSQLMQLQSDLDRQLSAQICLRCFISSQLKDFCEILERQFKATYDLRREELLPYVLDSSLDNSNSESLSDQILSRFDPSKGNLSTWTIRMAKSDRSVKRILLEHGIEQITDWFLLNQMTWGRLQQILTELNFTPVEIEYRLNLLKAYQNIYRSELLASRDPSSRRRYPEPKREHLGQMAALLQTTDLMEPEQILRQLQDLAQLLRKDRVNRKLYPRPKPPSNPQSSDVAITSEEQIKTCLADAIQQVIDHRLAHYQSKKTTPSAKERAQIKTKNFLKALYWFYSEGILMGDIAQRLGFNDQPKVTRLLQLKQLRSDIRRKTIRCLCDRMTHLAQQQGYLNSEQLQDLDAKIEQVLGDQIDQAIAEDQKIANTGSAYRQPTRLSQLICQYLETAIFHFDDTSFNIHQLIME